MVDAEHPVHAAGQVERVGDHHERASLRGHELVQQLGDSGTHVLVQVARGLVREKEARRMREGARERDPLLLAPREPVGECVRAVREPDTGEEPLRALPLLGADGTRELERQEQVLHHGERRQQVEELEDEADVPPAEARALHLGECRQVHVGDADPALVRQVDAADEVEQRRLARSRRPEHGHPLARLDAGARAVEHHVHPLSLPVALAQARQLEGGTGGLAGHRRSGQFVQGHP